MSYRTFKRRLSEIASHDLLEWIAFALGLAFFALAVACVWGVVVAISSLGDPDSEFKTSAGFLQATRGSGSSCSACSRSSRPASDGSWPATRSAGSRRAPRS